ncbi:unnamed protein product [Fraxinus pennsylvanica]|uniref:Uncharacterized protein n=1 Tax=Fraxinus pennsylvanica TaxID=56036 RepID=A0AAD2DRP2_9LAMI|nr:unnamed protein product [Fraxinus pennsylvanica]
MGSNSAICSILVFILMVLNSVHQYSAIEIEASQTALLFVNTSEASAKEIPENLFGIFFEGPHNLDDIRDSFCRFESFRTVRNEFIENLTESITEKQQSSWEKVSESEMKNFCFLLWSIQ